MNDTLRTIAERYTCRSFSDKMPSDEQLQAIAKAAVQAPSARNRQGWRVIVVKNQELICDMAEEGMKVLSQMEDKSGYDRIMSRGGKLFYNAPAMIVVPIEPTWGYAQMDCGILVENAALAAASLGLGSVICGMACMAFSKDRKEEFEKRLGFPEGFEIGIAVLIGYAAEGVTPIPHEPDMTKISVIE